MRNAYAICGKGKTTAVLTDLRLQKIETESFKNRAMTAEENVALAMMFAGVPRAERERRTDPCELAREAPRPVEGDRDEIRGSLDPRALPEPPPQHHVEEAAPLALNPTSRPDSY